MSIREFDVFCCSGYLDTCSLGVKNSWIFSLPCKEIWRTIDGFRLELIGTWSSGWGVASFTTTVGTRESADGLGEEDFIEDILRISLNFLYITIFQNSPKVFVFSKMKKSTIVESYLKLEKLCFAVINWLAGDDGGASWGNTLVIKKLSGIPNLLKARQRPKVTGIKLSQYQLGSSTESLAFSMASTHFSSNDIWASKIIVRNPPSTTAMSLKRVLRAKAKTSATGKAKIKKLKRK